MDRRRNGEIATIDRVVPIAGSKQTRQNRIAPCLSLLACQPTNVDMRYSRQSMVLSEQLRFQCRLEPGIWQEPQLCRDPQQFADPEVYLACRRVRFRDHHLNRIFELVRKRMTSHDCSLSAHEDFAAPAVEVA